MGATRGEAKGSERAALSARLRTVVDALPLRPGMRVIEVGGALGAAVEEAGRIFVDTAEPLFEIRLGRGSE